LYNENGDVMINNNKIFGELNSIIELDKLLEQGFKDLYALGIIRMCESQSLEISEGIKRLFEIEKFELVVYLNTYLSEIDFKSMRIVCLSMYFLKMYTNMIELLNKSSVIEPWKYELLYKGYYYTNRLIESQKCLLELFKCYKLLNYPLSNHIIDDIFNKKDLFDLLDNSIKDEITINLIL
jgi:hypothetical protein